MFKIGNTPWNKGKVGAQKGWNKGVNVPDSVKKKISSTLKKKFSSGVLDNPFKGAKHSKESRLKMSKAKWKGEDISNQHKHRRIEQLYGKPIYCEICKRSDRKRYDWANKNHKYSLKKEDWMRLCRGCHKRYDNKFNRKK